MDQPNGQSDAAGNYFSSRSEAENKQLCYNWHSAFQLGMGCALAMIHILIEFLRSVQSLAKNKRVRTRSGKNHRNNQLQELAFIIAVLIFVFDVNFNF